MFELPKKIKMIAAALTIVGLGLLVIGFNTDYSQASDGHDDHAVAQKDHDALSTHGDYPGEAHAAMIQAALTGEPDDSHAGTHSDHDAHAEVTHELEEGHAEASHAEHAVDSHDDHGAARHAENRPWAGLLVNTIFFLSIGLGALFFLAIQYAAQVGWSVGILRVMEAMALWLGIPMLVMFFIGIAGSLHWHHLYHWMLEGIADPASANYDKIIAGKVAWLNAPFFLARTVIYFIIWAGAAYLFRRNSLKEDAMSKGKNLFFTQRKLAATFLVLYAVTSSTSAWDFIMSIDTHWFSTMFGWYTFAGMFVTALTVMNLIVMYLRLGGHMPWVNANHQHDLGKFMFAFSVFWTYLWFSQYMLIWYSNIPEEVTYFMNRFSAEYKPIFIGMVALNFLLPILVLMSRDSKRIFGFLSLASVFILAGHWMDHFIMVMPGTVGYEFGFGYPELGGLLFYLGLFVLVVGHFLGKAPLAMKNHPMVKESKHFHQ
ncbi:MAG: quinol:cytochrome C oxidoreductase [Flavobacteriales bacterium]|jgi:hypothetical protein|nr:quinol:cytochrome C oxidoreductase [Flavobacteriales bacterium]MBT3573251.1 quinol:cytochrome C oxidoreductase [Flavobacteriales bacterium]MBT3677827.1 quinol:cytochrome C oxidoreductase [Flavobacteriales bacterium]MBT3739922.1 quinol:cytochrome C oxidoreductase [Flavobacteriales bacterium]MBT4102225.1 quinol:cytochrome C oxidoreductase [Flavobacteriales bacterium]